MKKCTIMLVLLFSVLSLLAQGEVDWERRVVRAVGIGMANPKLPKRAARPGAIRAAKLNALRELGESLKGMYISSNTKVENYVTTSDQINAQFEGILKAFRQVGKPNYFEDGTVEVTMEISIDGDLAALMLPEDNFTDNEPASSTDYETSASSQGSASAGGTYTGLIIDCTNIPLRPALSPKIIDESGSEIYGSAKVTRAFAVQQGMMGYLKDLEKAKGNSRVGENPFIVKATNVKGANKTDIVVSAGDAAKIKDLASKYNFMRECRVIAIIR